MQAMPDSDNPSPLEGTGYRAVEMVGRGAVGTVYKAEELASGRLVAVKLLHSKFARDSAVARRLEAEARILLALRHPHLVRCFGVGRTPSGIPFFVTELLHGRTLMQELVARGALPVLEAIQLTRSALSAVAEAHKLGIVHRDLTIHNLFIEEDGTLKVLDFGYAKFLAGFPDREVPSSRGARHDRILRAEQSWRMARRRRPRPFFPPTMQ